MFTIISMFPVISMFRRKIRKEEQNFGLAPRLEKSSMSSIDNMLDLGGQGRNRNFALRPCRSSNRFSSSRISSSSNFSAIITTGFSTSDSNCSASTKQRAA